MPVRKRHRAKAGRTAAGAEKGGAPLRPAIAWIGSAALRAVTFVPFARHITRWMFMTRRVPRCNPSAILLPVSA